MAILPQVFKGNSCVILIPNCSVFAIYRTFALSCIFGKVLDKMSMQRNAFKTSEIQYGFKQDRSTIRCTVLRYNSYILSYNFSVYLLLIVE